MACDLWLLTTPYRVSAIEVTRILRYFSAGFRPTPQSVARPGTSLRAGCLISPDRLSGNYGLCYQREPARGSSADTGIN